MQPQQSPSKPVMDIAPPPKPTGPLGTSDGIAQAPGSAQTNDGAIPTTTASAMPVKEAPRDPGSPQSQTGASDESVPEASMPPVETPKAKPKPAGQSVAGIVVATITVMILLASLTIVVYLNS